MAPTVDGGPDGGDDPPVGVARRWPARAGTAVAGAAPVLVLPEPALWWLAYVVLVPVLVLLATAASPGEAALRGWLAGAGFVLAVHSWLLPVTGVLLAGVAAAVGLLWVPWGVLGRHALRAPLTSSRVLAAMLTVPSGWLAVELVRSQEHLGGPWGLLGASQWQVPPALDLAALGGVWLVSAVLVAVNVAVAVGVLAAGRPGRPARVVAALAVLVLVAGAQLWSSLHRPEAGGILRVAAVQPGPVPGAAARFEAGERLTRELAGEDVDLVVWGESSVALDLGSRPDLRARLAGLSAAVDAPLLVNVDARTAGEPGIRKSAVLVGPAGVEGRYDKTRLVPFGEYVPLRPLLGWLTGVTDAAREDRVRGDRLVVLDPAGFGVGPLVCFESAFPDLTRRLVASGADLVVVQSSTWTFQHSWAPEQHASLAALRAAESGRPVVHVTLTGQSAAYDGRGRPAGPPLGTGQTGTVIYELALSRTRTPYAVLGDWVPAVAVLVLLGWATWRVTTGRGR
jgi:apolipoprotein N-acyltransferase